MHNHHKYWNLDLDKICYMVVHTQRRSGAKYRVGRSGVKDYRESRGDLGNAQSRRGRLCVSAGVATTSASN